MTGAHSKMFQQANGIVDITTEDNMLNRNLVADIEDDDGATDGPLSKGTNGNRLKTSTDSQCLAMKPV